MLWCAVATPSLAAVLRAEIHRLLARLHETGLSSAEAVVEAFADTTFEIYLSLVPRIQPAQDNAAPGQNGTAAGQPVLSEMEAAIVEVLSRHEVLSGPQIAPLAGYPYETGLKSCLASLRRRGIIGNNCPGYYLVKSPSDGR